MGSHQRRQLPVHNACLEDVYSQIGMEHVVLIILTIGWLISGAALLLKILKRLGIWK